MIEAYASADHWADHVAPVLAAVPAEYRGRLMRRLAPGNEPVLVASISDLRHVRATSGRPVALMEHGAGQSYGGTVSSARHPAYAGGDRRDADLFLHPGPHPAARDRATYPAAHIAIVGAPYLDDLPPRDPGPGPVIAVTWHADHSFTTETRTAFAYFRAAIGQLTERFQVIGSAHPHHLARLRPWYVKAGIDVVADFREVCRRADLLIADNTSVLFAFAATGRPVVVCNRPDYRRNVNHGLRFWDAADVGIQVDDQRDLAAAVDEALADPPARAAAREAALDLVYAFRSGGAKRAADVLVAWGG